ncbi:MAG: U32 family peptidase [Ruminococcus sp.]|nr:U32 family peptidase [Ruminococcus sp.]
MVRPDRKYPEVLVPAGDRERLKAALDYGADAIYLGGNQFTMRAAPANFSGEQLTEAVEMAHAKGVRVYLTCNTLPRNPELQAFPQFLADAQAAGVDAVIVADLGLLSMIRKYAPDMEIHMSTQTGIVNYATANMLYELGVRRVVLARELSLADIAEIRRNIPEDMEIEAFVHGAMCVSFSGRCLLSAYLTGRDANRGACAQPCRWKYHLMEETRPGQFFPVEEDDSGTYIMNAKDLCMIDYIPELVQAGVSSLKIEGRAKSAYYVSVVANAYRAAVDAFLAGEPLPQWVHDEVFHVSHRDYCTGFFFGHPKDCQRYEDNSYVRRSDVIGIVDQCRDGMVYATQRNRFFAEDVIEILAPGKQPVEIMLNGRLYNGDGEQIETANHAMMKMQFPCDAEFPAGSVIRKRVCE